MKRGYNYRRCLHAVAVCGMIASVSSTAFAQRDDLRLMPLTSHNENFPVTHFDALEQRSSKDVSTAQYEWAEQLDTPVTVKNSIGMEFVLIPPGRYLKGSPLSDGNAPADEKPREYVSITQPAFVGRTEVTQGQWTAIMETAPWVGSSNAKIGETVAATYIRWVDAVEFCKKLSEKERLPYRLLTDAEWEYCCRAGTTTKFYFGDNEENLDEYGWFDENCGIDGHQFAHEVAMKKPNAFGLFDTHGNAAEWCLDAYTADALGGTNPIVKEGSEYKIYRGGGWRDPARACRSAARARRAPESDDVGLMGFRVVLFLFEPEIDN